MNITKRVLCVVGFCVTTVILFQFLQLNNSIRLNDTILLQQYYEKRLFYKEVDSYSNSTNKGNIEIEKIISKTNQRKELNATESHNSIEKKDKSYNSIIKTNAQAASSESITKYNDEAYEGLLSKKPISFFRELQREIDDFDNIKRCSRYGFAYNSSFPKKRKIFYGAPIAEDSWEVLEIVAAESYGIFDGIVFVESNRTHIGEPRNLRWYNDRQRKEQQLKELFGVSNLQIRLHVDETMLGHGIVRQHPLRQAVVKGWKDLGMTVDDVGYLADADETFTRDVLRAVQVCSNIPPLDDYETHRCHNSYARINSVTRTYQGSPHCSQKGQGKKPQLLIGACIYEIGNSTRHPLPARRGFYRAEGYGRSCTDFEKYFEDHNITPSSSTTNKIINYPIYIAGDIRSACGELDVENLEAKQAAAKAEAEGKRGANEIIPFTYTAYHLHNFFPSIKKIRWKYFTYGEAVDANTAKGPLKNIKPAMDVMVKCVKNISNPERLNPLDHLKPPIPIYFHDTEYTNRRHQTLLDYVLEDEKKYGSNE